MENEIEINGQAYVLKSSIKPAQVPATRKKGFVYLASTPLTTEIVCRLSTYQILPDGGKTNFTTQDFYYTQEQFYAAIE